ncbi:MAG: hypothetical protein ACTSUX_09440 [Promethearchaeota archaeon]
MSCLNAFSYFHANYLKTVLHDPNYYPNVDMVSHAMRALPLKALKQFFFELLEEAYEFKITKNRMLIWDYQFVHSNSSEHFNRRKGFYNDSDAGFCMHQGRIHGVGYRMSIIYAYCSNDSVSVYYELFSGNIDEHSMFKATFSNFFELGLEKPLVLLADAGSYSIEILL